MEVPSPRHNDKDITYDDILNACENNHCEGQASLKDCARFLPQSQIKVLVQLDRVMSTLRQKVKQITEQRIRVLAEYVMAGAERVFLTLVYTGTVKKIVNIENDGFTDKDLPVGFEDSTKNMRGSRSNLTRRKIVSLRSGRILNFFTGWEGNHSESFFDKQWIFLAPEFRSATFKYKFHTIQRLPFLPAATPEVGSGYFGEVRKVQLHVAHYERGRNSHVGMNRNKNQHFDVAVKELKQADQRSDREKFYEREVRTLRTINNLKHNHLIKTIATYRKEGRRYFVFPWAHGGNLQHMMKTDQRALDKELVKWVLLQITGLSSAILALHHRNIRHGDIKPSNILCFHTETGSSNSKILVIADVGLSKLHEIQTSERISFTTTIHGTKTYEPPEVFANHGEVILSRRYDVWALGYVFLELIIWLLHGANDLRLFHEELSREPNSHSLWESIVSRGQNKHPVIRRWIEKLQKDVQEISAIHDLIKLIERSLLVLVNERADCDSLYDQVERIKKKAKSNEQYMFNAEFLRLAENRKKSRFAEQTNNLENGHLKTAVPADGRADSKTVHIGLMGMGTQQKTGSRTQKQSISGMEKGSTNRTDFAYWGPANQTVNSCSTNHSSNLDNKWRNLADNRQAQFLVSKLDWPSLAPEKHLSRMCQSHRILNLDAPRLEFFPNIQESRHDSTSCSLCHLLLRSLSKAKTSTGEPRPLFRDSASYALRSWPDGLPIFSIYCAPGSDFAPSYAQVGLPLLPRSASFEEFKLLSWWIKLCDQNHECVSNRNGTYLTGNMPTRVLDVGSPRIRLVETRKGSKGRYLALSHCWGKLKPKEKFCAYSHNIEILKKEISYELLPKSFQDAVAVTRALGISYLWIDSLCIIQDDTDDWKSEASKMGDVFNSAYCTIAASSAASSLDGFLGERIPRACATIETHCGPLYLAEFIDNFHSHVEQSVLSTRGWVLQERALSRRTIYFTSTQAYWECGSGVSCETLATLRNPQSQFLGDSNFPASGLKYYKDDRIRLIQHIYQIYSRLCLTNATDRPKAILGLQNRLACTFGSRAEYGLHERYLERTLLWQAEAPGSLSRISYPEHSAVPSWSWMACTGGIQYVHIPFKQVNWTGNIQNPFGSPTYNEEWDGRLRAQASKLLVNETELSKRATLDCKFYSYDSDTWKCIVVGKSKSADENGEIVHYILLVRSVSCASQTCERVGVGFLLADHISPNTETVFIN